MKTNILIVSTLALGALMLFSHCSKQNVNPGGAEMKAMDHETMPMDGQQAAAQTLASPEAKVGDWVVCPVMRTKFQVKENSLFVEVKGKKIYVCCAGCIAPIKANPEKYL